MQAAGSPDCTTYLFRYSSSTEASAQRFKQLLLEAVPACLAVPAQDYSGWLYEPVAGLG